MARVVFIVFEGAQTLDFAGPADVFASAVRDGAAAYEVVVASRAGGIIRTSAGCDIGTVALAAIAPRTSDTVLVCGGSESGLRAAMGDPTLRAWLKHTARLARRCGSVCTGAFVVAAAGLLDGKRAATHWAACDVFARSFPRVALDRRAIFVEDGRRWTSAGVTTGIDMAIAMVEADLGQRAAHDVATRLVLFMRRPGFQSQFSDALDAERVRTASLGEAIAWARSHLGRLNPDILARRAGLSKRTLHRRCREEFGTTPAKLIEKLRVEHAKALLEASPIATKALVDGCGFGSASQLHRAFTRELGATPRDYGHGTWGSPARTRPPRRR